MPLISNIFHYKSKNRILFGVLFFIISSFSLSAQTSPTLTLTDNYTDNLLSATENVTSFKETFHGGGNAHQFNKRLEGGIPLIQMKLVKCLVMQHPSMKISRNTVDSYLLRAHKNEIKVCGFHLQLFK